MSLYADDDLLPPDISSSGPSSLTTTAPLDPRTALFHAVQLPAESQAQYDALQEAGLRFEEYPDQLPELCGYLLPMVVDGGESMLRTWGLDMVALAVGRSALRGEIKADIAQKSLDALNRLLHSDSAQTIKAVIPIFSTTYPILFRILATSRPPQAIYDAFIGSKRRILSFVLDPNIRPVNKGIKAAAWKFVQKVLICGTRVTSADPRLQRGGNATGSGHDVHIGMITPASPLNVGDLEGEVRMLQEQVVKQMFASADPSVLHPIFNTFPLLCKSRPNFATLIVPSMAAWTPAALEAERQPGMHIRSVEKTLRIVMAHLLKTSVMASFHAQLNEALTRQKQRMEQAFPLEQEERRQRRQRTQVASAPHAGVPGASGLKHGLEPESSTDAVKRAKLDLNGAKAPNGGAVDISGLVLERIVDGVMGGLGAISMDNLIKGLESARQAIIDDTPEAISLLAASFGVNQGQPKTEDAVLNPLDMDLDDDEDDLLLAEPLPEEIEDEAITVTEFHLPPPGPLEQSEKDELVTSAFERICLTGDELAGLPDVDVKDGVKMAVQAKEAWMLVLVRLATRGQQEGKRKIIADYVVTDFAARSKLASVWLNEEWYSDLLNHTTNYHTHLSTILSAFMPTLTFDPKDKSLSTFLTSLPEITPQVIDQLIALCLQPERGVTGFIALRELLESRPPTRSIGLTRLLELCTHPDRKIRYPAIKTVNRWVPDGKMAEAVVAYARGLLRRLTANDGAGGPEKRASEATGEGEVVDEGPSKTDKEGIVAKTETGVEDTAQGGAADGLVVATTTTSVDPAEAVTTPYITALTPDTVPQHVELAFALSRRRQDLLAEIFALYPRLQPSIAEAIESLFTPLVQSLGPTQRLLEVIRNFPPGADKLALKVIGVLSSERGGAVVGEVVKGLLRTREDLDVGFVIPIIGELDKAEIERQIPRIVSLLGTSDSSRDLVRTAFAAALQKLTPADLLVSLHDEAESGRKATIEAIGICFSMTTVFRSDVLATSLSRITDLPTLPLVFLRTTIQAVSTYKSLIPFIANNILPKLVTKKVWEQPPLWDGFTRLVKMIAPHSFGCVLQLPREEMKDLVKRQPALRAGLRGFLEGKGMGQADLEQLFAQE